MIYLWDGKAGSGKSFNAVNNAYRRWLRGWDVAANIKLSFADPSEYGQKITSGKKYFSYLERYYYQIYRNYCTLTFRTPNIWHRGRIFYFQDIVETLGMRHCIIFFDDAGTILNSKVWWKLPEEFRWKIQLQRHQGIDLFATITHIRFIDPDYRRTLQAWFHCRRLVYIGTRRKCWFGIFLREMKDCDGMGDEINPDKVFTIRRKYFFIHLFSKKYYDTHAEIAFTKLKLVWLNKVKNNKLTNLKGMIIPKKQTIEQGLKSMFRHSRSTSGTIKSKNFIIN